MTCFYLLLFKLSASDEMISGNTTFTFLITLDKDLGELMMLKLRWEGSALWKNVWNRVQTIIPWGGQPRKPQLNLGKISVKAGETQDRYGLLLQGGSGGRGAESQSQVTTYCALLNTCYQLCSLVVVYVCSFHQ